jgi:hypothetical protein
MKKEKGFTLVELMGILVILGVLLIFTVPTITKTLNQSKAKDEEEYKNTVCLAAKTYLNINKSSDASIENFWNQTTGTSVSKKVSLAILADEGYLADNLKNPTSFTMVNVTRTIATDNITCGLTN